MDYSRIYNSFIADRRKKEPSLRGYAERHHILPRTLGGSDAEDNILRLVAEDHLMAHMLLAKVYGGSMWFALSSMNSGARNAGRVFVTSKRSRLAYRLSRENLKSVIQENFKDPAFAENHRLRTSEGTKIALADPDVKKRHLAGARASAIRLGYSGFRHDAHVKAKKAHDTKQAKSKQFSERMLLTSAQGRNPGFKSENNPAKSTEARVAMSARSKQMHAAGLCNTAACHTPEAVAKALETKKSSAKWAAFQERNRQPKPNQSGENHWRAKRKREQELAYAS